MEPRSLHPLLRTIAKPRASPTLTTLSRSSIQRQQRHQSTTARTKRALKIAPHPSFLNTPQTGSHVIFNPPSSKPSVYHTPFKFLPRSDPRRRANLTQLFRSSADVPNASPTTASGTNTADLPPQLPEPERKYNVTKEQVAEMRALRSRDPERWSVLKLAERYDCRPLFVMMCCRASAEHKDRERERLEAVKARWGPMKTLAREDRKKRKVLLLKDAL
ncbi:mitochondrial ribosomal protein subunit L20-domain-containing protein [Annulohypoxylon maeteangense]|uniref:mitochondrial ribosomal protein subunit L20-domain-containing protein n=1 Tax=Annulohypoxylon maeteangense TaxID=1927788 RepID=UPI002007BC36|nr:mitochondrial ribosomal protein subunit L20-domain-containing protein [Annulohypoxylon maeteangense]KAI0881731.1 mitochondrial ribosomal protein subunit L20-domain-containing protein [Annulohypoxylon maeteangense]